ncbi:hypothetical protein PIB30_098414 [Stylosanthes scabra]|uniref:Uncharacterized protein n=1 Tax=Stylosanthes scabra TaxID=79078 RepID=A0ABU6UVG6_9FABA|nr:hypothetical protein [Stylosanthes scabra]
MYPWGIYRHVCTCIVDGGEVHVLGFRSSAWEHVSYSVAKERTCHMPFVEGTSGRASGRVGSALPNKLVQASLGSTLPLLAFLFAFISDTTSSPSSLPFSRACPFSLVIAVDSFSEEAVARPSVWCSPSPLSLARIPASLPSPLLVTSSSSFRLLMLCLPSSGNPKVDGGRGRDSGFCTSCAFPELNRVSFVVMARCDTSVLPTNVPEDMDWVEDVVLLSKSVVDEELLASFREAHAVCSSVEEESKYELVAPTSEERVCYYNLRHPEERHFIYMAFFYFFHLTRPFSQKKSRWASFRAREGRRIFSLYEESFHDFKNYYFKVRAVEGFRPFFENE